VRVSSFVTEPMVAGGARRYSMPNVARSGGAWGMRRMATGTAGQTEARAVALINECAARCVAHSEPPLSMISSAFIDRNGMQPQAHCVLLHNERSIQLSHLRTARRGAQWATQEEGTMARAQDARQRCGHSLLNHALRL